MIMKAGKSQILQASMAGWRPRRAGAAEFPLVQERSVFCSRGQPSTDWVKPTNMTEGNLLYSKSIEFNVNLILPPKKKSSHRNIQNNVPSHL